MQQLPRRVLNGLMIVLFGAAAVVQYNDPDPVLWITVYGVAALCSALFLVGRLPRWFAAVLSGIYALSALYWLAQVLGFVGFFDPAGQEMLGVTEAGRELLGLLLAGGWIGALALMEKSETQMSKD